MNWNPAYNHIDFMWYQINFDLPVEGSRIFFSIFIILLLIFYCSNVMLDLSHSYSKVVVSATLAIHIHLNGLLINNINNYVYSR